MADFSAQSLAEAPQFDPLSATPDAIPAQALFSTAAEDTVKPVVDNYSPAVGSTVNEADPIFFDVTDDSGEFAGIIVAVKQGGATEVVHDGTNFLEPYDDLSSRSNIPNGFRYRIRRTGGWVDTVVQTAFVFDKSGNVAT